MGDSSSGWPDRYRPDDLESMALAPALRERFKRYLSGDALPRSLILYGPPGFGKTTIARVIASTLYTDDGWPRVRWVRSTETGNVDTIRNDIVNYMRGLPSPRLVIFEEATGLSPQAQEALRVPLENWADICRVIFITNDISKLDAAIQSRCDAIELTRPPIQECARVLDAVLKTEGANVPSADVLSFTRGHFHAEEGRDLRSLLASGQHFIETTGNLPAQSLSLEAERSLVMDEVWQTSASPTDQKEGARILNDLSAEFSKYISLPQGGAEALALWTLFAWAHEAFSISPILTLVSPTPRAGKSTVFEMLEQILMPGQTFHSSSLTPPVLYRLKGIADEDQAIPSTVAKPPTVCWLIDEVDLLKLDRVFRAVLNSGHARRGAFVHRMIGTREVGKFSTWYPKALALIDRPKSPLPDALRDRSIVIPMQRMTAEESRAEFPRHQTLPSLATLSTDVVSWVRDQFNELRELAGGSNLADKALNARARDNWHPLMCVARAAGGGWEERARQASLILSDATREPEQLGDLLSDVRAVFNADVVEAMASVKLVDKLKALDDSPWKELRLTPIKLSRLLRPAHIRPKQLWTDAGGRKANKMGYERAQFEDAFARYL